MKDEEMLEKEQGEKKTFNNMLIFFVVTAVVNVLVAPLSLFIGGMATAAPGSGFLGFMFGFLYVQIIPLILFISAIVTILVFVRKAERFDFMTTFIIFMVVVNIGVAPASIYMGLNAKALQGGGFFEFVYGALCIQTIPLLTLLIGIRTLRRLREKD